MDNSPRNFRATKSSIGSSGPHSRENVSLSEFAHDLNFKIKFINQKISTYVLYS